MKNNPKKHHRKRNGLCTFDLHDKVCIVQLNHTNLLASKTKPDNKEGQVFGGLIANWICCSNKSFQLYYEADFHRMIDIWQRIRHCILTLISTSLVSVVGNKYHPNRTIIIRTGHKHSFIRLKKLGTASSAKSQSRSDMVLYMKPKYQPSPTRPCWFQNATRITKTNTFLDYEEK